MLKFWPAVKILAMENIPILIGKPCDLSAQICAQLQGQPSGTRSEYGSPSLQSVVWFNLGLSKNQGYPKYPQLLYQVQCLNWGSWLSTWGILFSDKPIWTVFFAFLVFMFGWFYVADLLFASGYRSRWCAFCFSALGPCHRSLKCKDRWCSGILSFSWTRPLCHLSQLKAMFVLQK